MKPNTNRNCYLVKVQAPSTQLYLNSLFVFFQIQQWPCHNNIVADKGLNLFHECAAECVHLSSQEEECTSSSWGDSKMYRLGTIANSQTDWVRAILHQSIQNFQFCHPSSQILIKFCWNVPNNKKREQKWANFFHLTLNGSWDISFWNLGNFRAFFSEICYFEFSVSNEIVITWVL